ncbi:hypothetical protein LR48_Vigan03g081700 [Vigna angularis]|uniref:Uncharacterized protein n=1 Tax=Phaseolus angularis TaxID=3914 RepID=A0A0L9U3R3_PHAAN|nr:hypothetical protein LR48_Vigan03g081700 [Vigna angularis]
MATSSSRPGKCPASLVREANPFGWFNDEEQRTDFICQWGFKEVIRHKYLSILFFRTEGFLFQEWLVNSGLTNFFELQGDCYSNLVKVLYANLKRKKNYLISRVKGVTIRIDDSIWKYVVGFQPRGLKAHHGILGFNKVDIYNKFLKDRDMIGKYDSLSIDHLSKEERICAYVIT